MHANNTDFSRRAAGSPRLKFHERQYQQHAERAQGDDENKCSPGLLLAVLSLAETVVSHTCSFVSQRTTAAKRRSSSFQKCEHRVAADGIGVANDALSELKSSVARRLSDAVVNVGVHDDGATNGVAPLRKQGEGDVRCHVLGHQNVEGSDAVRIRHEVAEIAGVPSCIVEEAMHLKIKGKVRAGERGKQIVANIAERVHVNAVARAAVEARDDAADRQGVVYQLKNDGAIRAVATDGQNFDDSEGGLRVVGVGEGAVGG